MAPADVSAYLPPLDQCLNGEKQILSWKAAFTALAENSSDLGQNSLRRFLNNTLTTDVLIDALGPRRGPTAATKADFETFTSAINVAPNSDSKYDLQQIKDDTLWLSNEVKVDEVSALRIIALEWQTRAEKRLFHEERTDEPPTFSGSTRLKSSLLLSRIRAPANQQDGNLGNFESEAARRFRILNTYLSERRYLYKSLGHIISSSLFLQPPVADGNADIEATRVHERRTAVQRAGQRVLEAWNYSRDATKSQKTWVMDMVFILGERLDALATGSGISVDDALQLELETAWCETNLTEMVQLLHTAFSVAYASQDLLTAASVVSWFEFMDEHAFFGLFEPPNPALRDAYVFPIRSLATMASLAIINLPKAMDAVSDLSSAGHVSNDDSRNLRYLQDVGCIESITVVLLVAANNGIINCKPVALAWATVLQQARDYADSSTAARDQRNAYKAAESIGNSAISDTESIEGASDRRRASPYRRTSFGSDTSQPLTYLEEMIDTLQKIEPTDDVINLLANYAAHNAQAFELTKEIALNLGNCFGSEQDEQFSFPIRSALLDLIASSVYGIAYQPELLETVFAILSGTSDYWDSSNPSSKALNVDLVNAFQTNGPLMDRIFYISLARFPYESLPFLKLCQAFAAAPGPNDQDRLFVPSILRNLTHLTTTFSEKDAAYELDEESDGGVRLLSPLDILATGQGVRREQAQLLLPYHSPKTSGGSADIMLLPSGTVGQPLTDGKPLVVRFAYPYSGLRYLGLVLRQALEARHNPHIDLTEPLFDIATEIISLLSRLLLAASTQAQENGDLAEAQELARSILEESSDGLGRNQDVVTLIFETFEDELYEQKSGLVTETPTTLLVYCTQFVHALLSILPGRVWPFLGKSGLLGLNGAESRLAFVVAVLEVPSGHFAFLWNTVNLFEALVDNAVLHSVSRQGGSTSLTRFESAAPDAVGSGITETLMKSILLHFERIMIEVFQSTSNWRFSDLEQRLKIEATISRTFSKILGYCFDTDDEEDLSKKLSSPLALCAEYLLAVFLSTATNDLPTQPLIQALHDGACSSPDTIPISFGRARVQLTEQCLGLVSQLVRINTYLGRPVSRLQQQLFTSTSAIAKCYAVHERYRAPVVELLEALVLVSSKVAELPPSLLGHLGQQVAQSFIDLLARLDEPLDSPALERHIWKLLSSVVSKRQQWFAIYILTGNTPKKTLRDKSDQTGASRPRPHLVFELAISKLRKISQTNLSEMVHVLEFVSLAADFWPDVCERIRNDNTLIKALADYLENLKEPSPDEETLGPDHEALQTQVAAYIVSIFAMIVHRSNERRQSAFAKQILPKLNWLMQHGVSTPKYNASLHSRLRKNFESKFPNIKLSQFKRTAMAQPQLGRGFYYNISLADNVLQHDAAWNRDTERGFHHEFILANRNLSIVEAQMNLFHGWKSLLVELALGLDIDGGFQASVAASIRQCLTNNLETNMPEAIFSRLVQSRASLAFNLLQRLIGTASNSTDARSILKPAWETLRDVAPDLGAALTSSDSDYVRMLLKILYLALQAHLPTQAANESTSGHKDLSVVNTILEILKRCVASGFRSLVTLLHEDVSKVTPADVALLNGILRTCLRIPEVDKQTEVLVTIFTDEKSALYASTLLSWSHQLALDRDPVYGELSLTFLLELSSIPTLAEYIVTAGTLGRVASADIMKFLRRQGGTGPFDDPSRLYSIWTRALLPLAINLLTAIGAPIAGDVGTFINQFGPQLDRASVSLDTKTTVSILPGVRASYVTLAMASEVHSLALISSVLDMFREAGASVGLAAAEVPEIAWERSVVKSDLETRLQRPSQLREDIIPSNDREEGLAKQKPLTNSRFEHRLEEMVVGELGSALALLADVES